MFFNKCCFFLPLDTGCFIIALLFLSFHVGEMVTYSTDCIFVRDTTDKTWAVVLMAAILMMSIISSGLLIYGARRKRRGPVLFWLTVFSITLFFYIILGIVDIATENPPVVTIFCEILIIVSLIYSLMVVHSFYKSLKYADDDYEDFVP